jgi:sugar lactone lactonase YvrE
MRWLRVVTAAVLVSMVIPVSLQAAGAFPDLVALPNGWRPEGVAVGRGHDLYSGSLATGAVYKADLRTGDGAVLVPPHAGRVAVGLKVDNRGRIFVAGGPTGHGYVYDADGGDVADYTFAAAPTFVNDVVVTRTAAWFTDSFRPVLYRVAIGDGGELATTAEIVPLSGDFQPVAGFNINGIDATPDGTTLVIVQSATGKVFAVDPVSGDANEIELDGGNAAFGDGILLHGTTLYVVQNQLNRIAVVELAADLGSGAVVGHMVDSDLDVPTTIAKFGSTLYAVNARFSTPPTPATPYQVVALSLGS